MRRTIAVINGEQYWQTYFPDFEVVNRRLQDSSWVLRDGELWCIDRESATRLDGVMWRVGAIRPDPRHRTALEIIRLSGVPCVNPASTLVRCYDRLSMLAELRAAGLPVIPFSVALGDDMVRRIARPAPFVVKVGNHHGGYGKTLVRSEAEWFEIADLLFATNDYAVIEPYIDYRRDVRCLAIGERFWSMARAGAGWKANVQTRKHQVIDPPEALVEHTRTAMRQLGADILALDFLETQEGEYVLLEANDTPGLSGFPEQLRAELADCLRNRLTGG
jgi:ribosomal protein S6--L-glutamate ligase